MRCEQTIHGAFHFGERARRSRFLGQVGSWGCGVCLVEDGFDERPVAEHRGAAGVVLELAQGRFDFGPHGIGDGEVRDQDSSPKPIVDGEPYLMLLGFVNTAW